MDNEKLKTWLVVGASSGFGHEICRQLLAKNKNVIAVAASLILQIIGRCVCLLMRPSPRQYVPQLKRQLISLGT